MNAVIRAVTLALINEAGARVTGIERGFLGLLTRASRPLDTADASGLLAQGSTVLDTHNKCDPIHHLGAGGADCSAHALAYARELGLPVVGVPKTIDNDLYLTKRTFGFDSAVAVVAEALDRLSTTAPSHGRVMTAETMGRYAGWIALEGGMAGGADVILNPELPFSVEAVAARCREREQAGGHTIICIAEGARAIGDGLTVECMVADGPDPLRLGGVDHLLQHRLQPLLQSEVRTTLLGHLQARWLTHAVRPRAGHALRSPRRAAGEGRAARPHGGTAGRRLHQRADLRGGRPQPHRAG